MKDVKQLMVNNVSRYYVKYYVIISVEKYCNSFKLMYVL